MMEVQKVSNDLGDLEAMLASITAQEAAETASEEAEILAALEGEIEAAAVEAEPEPVAADEELDDEALAELEASINRAEVYEAQKPTADTTLDAATAPVINKPARVKKAGSTGATARTPRKSLNDLPDAVFQILDGSPVDKAAVIGKRPLQVKIAEKFDNLFLALDAGKLPSAYVVTAMKALDKTGTMTSADLIAAYKAEGLGDGTARSQTGQIMELFNAVGIAARSKQTLALRADSVIATKLRAIIASQPTA